MNWEKGRDSSTALAYQIDYFEGWDHPLACFDGRSASLAFLEIPEAEVGLSPRAMGQYPRGLSQKCPTQSVAAVIVMNLGGKFMPPKLSGTNVGVVAIGEVGRVCILDVVNVTVLTVEVTLVGGGCVEFCTA